MDQQKSQENSAYAALLAVQFLFGFNYIASKIIVDSISPMIWAAVRVIISTVALYFFTHIWKSKPRPELTLSFVGRMTGYSALGVVINQASFLSGLHLTTATNSAVLNTLIPVFTLLFVTLSGVERGSWKRTVGFFLALTGVLALRRVENFTLSDQTLVGDLLVMLNCASYAVFLTISKRYFSRYDTIYLTTWMFFIGSFLLTLLSIPHWDTFSMPNITPDVLASMFFSIFGATLGAYLLNNWALAKVQSSSVALFIYLQPVIAALLAWIWFGQTVTPRTVVSTALIFFGMLLCGSNKKVALPQKTPRA